MVRNIEYLKLEDTARELDHTRKVYSTTLQAKPLRHPCGTLREKNSKNLPSATNDP